MMLCCDRCEKPVMLLTEEQAQKVHADRERYRFLCTDCERALEDVDA